MSPTLESITGLMLADLSPALADGEARSAVRRLAYRLPAVYWGGFEVRLAPGNVPVDFHMGIEGPKAAKRIIDADLPQLFPQEAQGWERIESFLRCWQDPTTRLHQTISYIVLEFDLGRVGDARSLPAVFWSFPETLQQEPPGEEALHTIKEAMTLLYGTAPSDGMMQTAAQCLKNRPPATVPFHAGTRPGEKTMALRLNLWGFDPAHDESPLSAPLNTTAYDAARLPADVASAIDTAVLAVDITDRVLPDIGLECVPRQATDGGSGWDLLLRKMTAAGLCESEKMKGLLAWPGIRTPAESESRWPEELIFEGLMAEPGAFGLFRRALSHVKISFPTKGRPTAKGYLQYDHRWEYIKPGAFCRGDFAGKRPGRR